MIDKFAKLIHLTLDLLYQFLEFSIFFREFQATSAEIILSRHELCQEKRMANIGAIFKESERNLEFFGTSGRPEA